jgi:hypothetical protein
MKGQPEMDKPTLPWRTERETRQCLQDQGHRIAAIQAFAYLGRVIETDPDFPLPPGTEDMIALAAATMADIAARRQARAEAYALERRAAIQRAAGEVCAATHPRSAA